MVTCEKVTLTSAELVQKKYTAQLNQLFFVTMTTVSPQCWSITVIPHRQAFQPEPLLSFTQTGSTVTLTGKSTAKLVPVPGYK